RPRARRRRRSADGHADHGADARARPRRQRSDPQSRRERSDACPQRRLFDRRHHQRKHFAIQLCRRRRRRRQRYRDRGGRDRDIDRRRRHRHFGRRRGHRHLDPVGRRRRRAPEHAADAHLQLHHADSVAVATYSAHSRVQQGPRLPCPRPAEARRRRAWTRLTGERAQWCGRTMERVRGRSTHRVSPLTPNPLPVNGERERTELAAPTNFKPKGESECPRRLNKPNSATTACGIARRSPRPSSTARARSRARARTYHVPAGRPKRGNPPFPWDASAIDALTMAPHELQKVKAWSVERILYETEKYNGWGYLKRGNSPYLWSWTSEYRGGKYVRDGVYDPNHWDEQAGCVALLKVLAALEPAVAARLTHREA